MLELQGFLLNLYTFFSHGIMCLVIQPCRAVRSWGKQNVATDFAYVVTPLFSFISIKNKGFAGHTSLVFSVLAPPPLGMETGQSAAAFQVINSVYSAYMSRRMLQFELSEVTCSTKIKCILILFFSKEFKKTPTSKIIKLQVEHGN